MIIRKYLILALCIIILLIITLVGYAKYKCPGQNLYSVYMSLKLGVNCNDNVALKIGDQTVGYIVVPGGNTGILKSYDESFNSGIKAEIGSDGLSHYASTTLGISLSFDPKMFSIVEDKSTRNGTTIDVLQKRNPDTNDLPHGSLSISVSERINDGYHGEIYKNLDELLKETKRVYEGLNYNIFITTLGNKKVVERDGETYADGKTIGKYFYPYDSDRYIVINYQYIPGDESAKKMETLLNSIQFSTIENPPKIESNKVKTTPAISSEPAEPLVDLKVNGSDDISNIKEGSQITVSWKTSSQYQWDHCETFGIAYSKADGSGRWGDDNNNILAPSGSMVLIAGYVPVSLGIDCFNDKQKLTGGRDNVGPLLQ